MFVKYTENTEKRNKTNNTTKQPWLVFPLFQQSSTLGLWEINLIHRVRNKYIRGVRGVTRKKKKQEKKSHRYLMTAVLIHLIVHG